MHGGRCCIYLVAHAHDAPLWKSNEQKITVFLRKYNTFDFYKKFRVAIYSLFKVGPWTVTPYATYPTKLLREKRIPQIVTKWRFFKTLSFPVKPAIRLCPKKTISFTFKQFDLEKVLQKMLIRLLKPFPCAKKQGFKIEKNSEIPLETPPGKTCSPFLTVIRVISLEFSMIALRTFKQGTVDLFFDMFSP